MGKEEHPLDLENHLLSTRKKRKNKISNMLNPFIKFDELLPWFTKKNVKGCFFFQFYIISIENKKQYDIISGNGRQEYIRLIPLQMTIM